MPRITTARPYFLHCIQDPQELEIAPGGRAPFNVHDRYTQRHQRSYE